MRLTNKQIELLSEIIHAKVEEKTKEFNSVCDTAPYDKNDSYFIDYEFIKNLEKEIQQRIEIKNSIIDKYINKQINEYNFSRLSSSIFNEKTREAYKCKLQGKKDIPSRVTIEKAIILASLEDPKNIIDEVINHFIQ